VHLSALELTDFRCYRAVELSLPDGVTVLVGANGEGKTSLLEAAGWAATTRSFRGVNDSALVRAGADRAILRAEVVDDGRRQSLEAELRVTGRNRVLLNRHPLTRTRDLLGLLRVTVFAPDDLQLVKGGPSERRQYLDDLLVAIAPRYEAARADYDRVLRHRNALLRGHARDPEALATLDVFDEQLVAAGGELVRGRLRLVERLLPIVDEAYRRLATDDGLVVDGSYEAEWAAGAQSGPVAPGEVEELLRSALATRRRQEQERGVTLVGPHRDEWRLTIRGLDSRTHASQGEQRTLALALRLGGHRACTDIVGSAPVLLLDDVFSELDEQRALSLVKHLPAGQTLVTTAGSIPDGVTPALRLRVAGGAVRPEAA
jgi:DNA replication and repair protein RecF